MQDHPHHIGKILRRREVERFSFEIFPLLFIGKPLHSRLRLKEIYQENLQLLPQGGRWRPRGWRHPQLGTPLLPLSQLLHGTLPDSITPLDILSLTEVWFFSSNQDLGVEIILKCERFSICFYWAFSTHLCSFVSFWNIHDFLISEIYHKHFDKCVLVYHGYFSITQMSVICARVKAPFIGNILNFSR